MKTVQYAHTLYYYDAPQVIEARDAIGGCYVGVLLADGGDRYLVVGVDPVQLSRFRTGESDLRSIMEPPATGEYFFGQGDLSQPIPLSPADPDEVRAFHLPDAGFVLYEAPANSTVVAEARNRSNLVLELTVNPPEARTGHRIQANTLTGLLQHIQTIIKHAYGHALRELPPAARRGADRADAHRLDVVVPAMPGSFKVVLEAGKRPDLFGGNELTRALERVDTLFEGLDKPDVVMTRLREHKGHLAGAFARLVKFLARHDTGLHYEWATPEFKRAQVRSVTQAQTEALVGLLSGISNLGAEQIILEGELEEADLTKRSWRLTTESGKETGTVAESGPSLDGLRLGARYRFECIEELDEADATGREIRRVYLTGYTPVA